MCFFTMPAILNMLHLIANFLYVDAGIYTKTPQNLNAGTIRKILHTTIRNVNLPTRNNRRDAFDA